MTKLSVSNPCSVGPSKLGITPYRVTNVLNRTIYEFWKIGCAPTSMRSALSDPKIPRQLATLCFISGQSTFCLSFYPNQEEPQIIKDLPMEQLPQVVTDLLAAGFGTEEDHRAMAESASGTPLLKGKEQKLLT